MPIHYKDLRDELNEILWHFNVPRELYFRLLDLRKFMLYKIPVHCAEDNTKMMRSLELIEEIMPPNRKNGNNNVT